jgi:hypothetical protein
MAVDQSRIFMRLAITDIKGIMQRHPMQMLHMTVA